MDGINQINQRIPFITAETQRAAELAPSITTETDLAFLATWLHHHTDAARLLSAHVLSVIGSEGGNRNYVQSVS